MLRQSLPIFCVLSFVAVGCASRAPTECELDRRSGLYPSSFCDGEAAKNAAPAAIAASPANAMTSKPASVPVREQPTVARVWVHDQLLDGGTLMQGTWAYIEVEPSHWARDGQGPLFVSPRATTTGTAFGASRTRGSSTRRAFNPAPSNAPINARTESRGAQ